MAKSLAHRYRDTLAQMGYPSRVEPGTRSKNVWFDVLGTRYVLTVDPSDPEFFLLMTMYGLGGVRFDSDVAERARDVNALVKGVKVVPVPDDGLVRFSVEMLLEKPPASRAILERSLELLAVGIHEFFKDANVAPVLNRPQRKKQLRRRGK